MGGPLKDSVRVLIADTSVADRDQLVVRMAPFPEIDLAGYAQDGEEALNAVRAFSPDVVIFGLAPHAGLGRDLIREIHMAHPSVAVIMLARQMPIPVQRLWLDLGVDFCLDKETELESLIGVVASLRNGKSYYRFRQ